jgi:hypothetical protein
MVGAVIDRGFCGADQAAIYIRAARLGITLKRGRTGTEGEGEIMTPCVSTIPHHRERASLQSIKNRNWVVQANR